jgi:Flp pilus assembly protein TadG
MARASNQIARRGHRFIRAWRPIAGDARGVAALEFALIAGSLVFAMLNTVDVARYYYARMQVQNAAQMGGQSAWQTCNVPNLPATTNCSGLSAAVTTAVQSTSLGTNVTLQSGSPSEGYYCVDTSGALHYVSAVSSPPSDCSSVGSVSDTPGDYIQVQTSYTYAPYFAISVGGLLPTPITATSLMRLQ